MSLENAKQAANHFLDRMSYTKDVPAETRQTVAAATNLYEVNKAVLGADWNDGYSNTYDPTLELSLTSIDTTALTGAIAKADALLADGATDTDVRTTLTTARNAAVTGLTSKLYTGADVVSWTHRSTPQSQMQRAASPSRNSQAQAKRTNLVPVTHHTTSHSLQPDVWQAPVPMAPSCYRSP